MVLSDSNPRAVAVNRTQTAHDQRSEEEVFPVVVAAAIVFTSAHYLQMLPSVPMTQPNGSNDDGGRGEALLILLMQILSVPHLDDDHHHHHAA